MSKKSGKTNSNDIIEELNSLKPERQKVVIKKISLFIYNKLCTCKAIRNTFSSKFI